VGKGGVVRDSGLHAQVLEETKKFCRSLEWEIGGEMQSPLLGPKGNKEFLLYIRRE